MPPPRKRKAKSKKQIEKSSATANNKKKKKEIGETIEEPIDYEHNGLSNTLGGESIYEDFDDPGKF